MDLSKAQIKAVLALKLQRAGLRPSAADIKAREVLLMQEDSLLNVSGFSKTLCNCRGACAFHSLQCASLHPFPSLCPHPCRAASPLMRQCSRSCLTQRQT